VRAHRDELLASLDEWLRIPSISALPEHAADVARSADWLAAALREHGFPTVEVWSTADGAGLPSVFAEWPAEDPGAPTVLVYGHHDVQPVDPVELWTTAPFEPTLDGDVLRGRGSSDDKGQVAFHLLGLRAHLAAGRSAPAVHLKLLVEGEEESGSTNFAALLTAERERLRCDVVVVSDTTMYAATIPSTVTGMRGLVGCTVSVQGPDRDLHSGSYGGAVPNPATGLARLLAAMHDNDGRVTVPGFYDDVVELTAEERDLFARLPFDQADWLTVGASRAAAGERGYTTLERVWARPTAEVNGLSGGYTGVGHKTIIPASAFAKVSFRLVAHQSPDRIMKSFETWVDDQLPAGLTGQVTWEGGGVRACLTPIDHPAVEAVRRALSLAYDGADVLVTREGGSGPEADLASILEAPVVFLGLALNQDRFHAPDESVEVERLLRGAEAAAHLWEDMAQSLRAS
jgi:acetylornithine deacetylase/succinyl-diaminopimelate desuccinylase-like protein